MSNPIETASQKLAFLEAGGTFPEGPETHDQSMRLAYYAGSLAAAIAQAQALARIAQAMEYANEEAALERERAETYGIYTPA